MHQPTVEGSPHSGPESQYPPGDPSLMYQPTVEGAPPDQFAPLDSDDPDADPRPWYRRPVMLILWAVLVLILLGLIAYGVSQLFGSGKSPAPAPSTSSTTSTTTTTTESSSTTATTTESTSTEPSNSSTAAPAPPNNPPRSQPPQQPTQQPTHRGPHLPQLPPLPSTITVPGGPTITVPKLP